MHFIYVMSEEDKDKMMALGYALVKEDKRNYMWVFRNKDAASFAREDELSGAGVKFALSNTLTF